MNTYMCMNITVRILQLIYVQRMNLIRRMKILPELLIRILLLSPDMKVCRNGVKVSVGAVVAVPDIIVPIYGTLLSTWLVCIYKRICLCTFAALQTLIYIEIIKRGDGFQPLFISNLFIWILFI